MNENEFVRRLNENMEAVSKRQEQIDLFLDPSKLAKQLAEERWPVIEQAIDKWEEVVCNLLYKVGTVTWMETGFIRPKRIDRKKLRYDYENNANVMSVRLNWKIYRIPEKQFSDCMPYFEVTIKVIFYLGYCHGTQHKVFFNVSGMGSKVLALESEDDLAECILATHLQGPELSSRGGYAASNRKSVKRR